MPAVHAIFELSPGLSGMLLRAAMWSQWSHVALVVADEPDCIIDATYLNGGVRRRSLSELAQHAKRVETRTFDCPDPKAAFDWARSQIGKPYDTWGVLGIGFHRDWNKDDAWFCSEFFEAALAAGGNSRFIEDRVHRVTVEHSWMVK